MSYKARCDVTDIVMSLTTIKRITAPLNLNIYDYHTNIFYIVLSFCITSLQRNIHTLLKECKF